MNSNEKPLHVENSPNVVFRNEPKVSEHEIDRGFNEMRVEFVPYIKKFVEEHILFKNEDEVGIEFAHRGVSSVVAIIDTPTQKVVLKIPRSKTFSAGEGQFLKVWEAAGVMVPHVIETGEIHGSPYTLMQFIDAPTLDSKYSNEELMAKGLYAEMGKMLRLMHSTKVGGYGFVVNGNPEFEAVEDWLEGNDMKTRFDYIEKNNLLTGSEDVRAKALDIIKQYSKTAGSTYCHDDFGPPNIFATDPITVFDTSPKFNNGYYDLGRIKLADIAYGGSGESSKQLLEGYCGEEECNNEVLNAYTFLALCMKAPYWHKTARGKELEIAKNYFRQNQI